MSATVLAVNVVTGVLFPIVAVIALVAICIASSSVRPTCAILPDRSVYSAANSAGSADRGEPVLVKFPFQFSLSLRT